VAGGSTGWSPPWSGDAPATQIMWEVRAPRSVGVWLTGALLGLAGALSQGLFRNPLADPYLLGSSSGAALAVAIFLAVAGVGPASAAWFVKLGLTGAAFLGAVGAVVLTLVLARGVQHTLRLLLAGVVVGVVLGAVSALIMLMVPDIMWAMQAFMLGTTGFLGWDGVAILGAVLPACLVVAWASSRALDALSLGDAAALSLGVKLSGVRALLVGTLALATGAAVAQAGMIAFVGLVAPHLVRRLVHSDPGRVLFSGALAGAALLLAADIGVRLVPGPVEIKLGVVTALIGVPFFLMMIFSERRALQGVPS